MSNKSTFLCSTFFHRLKWNQLLEKRIKKLAGPGTAQLLCRPVLVSDNKQWMSGEPLDRWRDVWRRGAWPGAVLCGAGGEENLANYYRAESGAQFTGDLSAAAPPVSPFSLQSAGVWSQAEHLTPPLPPNTGPGPQLHRQFFCDPAVLEVLGGNFQIDNRGRKSVETQQCRYITTGFNAQYNCYNFSNISAICCRKRWTQNISNVQWQTKQLSIISKYQENIMWWMLDTGLALLPGPLNNNPHYCDWLIQAAKYHRKSAYVL